MSYSVLWCLRRSLRRLQKVWLKSLVSSSSIIAHTFSAISHAYQPQIHLFPDSHAHGFVIAKDTSTRRQFIAFLRASGLRSPSPDRSRANKSNAIHHPNMLYQMYHSLLPLRISNFLRARLPAAAVTKKTKTERRKTTEQRKRPPYTAQHSNHRVSPQATLGAPHQPNCLG
jgi:hypothetical protein